MAFPNTFLTLQNQVVGKLRLDANPSASSSASDATNDRAKVKDALNRVYADMVADEEAFAACANIALAANEPDYTLPTGAHRIEAIVIKGATQTSFGQPLLGTSMVDILEKRYSNGTTSSGSTPSHYSLIGEKVIALWPTPADAGTMRAYYTGLPTALSADGDLPIIPEPYVAGLEYGALADLGELIKDPNAFDYRAIHSEWRAKWRRHINRRVKGPVEPLRIAAISGSTGRRNDADQ